MNDNLPDNAPSQDLRHDEVQDYLDILLRQATERPEAQPDQITEHKEQAESTRVLQQPVGKSAALLTMIGGTSVAPVRPAIVNGFPPTKVSLPPSILPSSARPFAEPSKPLAFKVRIPKAPDSDEAPAVPPVEKQPEPANQLLLSPVPEQAHEPEVVSSPAAESVTEVKTSPLLASQYQWMEGRAGLNSPLSAYCLVWEV
jgi:hypothetical protein